MGPDHVLTACALLLGAQGMLVFFAWGSRFVATLTPWPRAKVSAAPAACSRCSRHQQRVQSEVSAIQPHAQPSPGISSVTVSSDGVSFGKTKES